MILIPFIIIPLIIIGGHEFFFQIYPLSGILIYFSIFLGNLGCIFFIYVLISSISSSSDEEKKSISEKKSGSSFLFIKIIVVIIILVLLNPILSPLSAIRDSDLNGVPDHWDWEPFVALICLFMVEYTETNVTVTISSINHTVVDKHEIDLSLASLEISASGRGISTELFPLPLKDIVGRYRAGIIFIDSDSNYKLSIGDYFIFDKAHYGRIPSNGGYYYNSIALYGYCKSRDLYVSIGWTSI